MTQRVEGGQTYAQVFDAENRLISVTAAGSQITEFIYDGDGNMIKKINPDGSKTIYVSGLYEVDKSSGGSVTRTVSYYPVAGAMRIDGTLYYALKDHLGSASVVTHGTNGSIVGEQRYNPYGETRIPTGSMFTDKLFTGQREMAGLGIYHYGARFYSPKLARFISADTIVPDPSNPQDWNRYAYARNNPVRYTDPSGHAVSCDAEEDCKEVRRVSKLSARDYVDEVLSTYGVRLTGGGWDNANSIAVLAGVVAVGSMFASVRSLGESGSTAFREIYDHIDIKWEGGPGKCGNTPVSSGGCTDGAHQIRFWSQSGHGTTDIDRMAKNVVHELGHAFDWTHYSYLDLTRASDHMSIDFTRGSVLRPNPFSSGRWDFQQSPETTSSEVFADMFVALTYDTWNTDIANATMVNNAQSWIGGLVP